MCLGEMEMKGQGDLGLHIEVEPTGNRCGMGAEVSVNNLL